jgi:hypothetical protein
MAVETRFASFNLHLAGKTATAKVRDATAIFRGGAETGTAEFTDPNRDFGADGFTGAAGETIQILDGGGNIQREVAITGVAVTVLTVAGGNFDTTENNLRYRVWVAPTDTEIIDDPRKRGVGLIGWQEMLTKIESGMLANFLSQIADVFHSEGLTQQSITYDPQFVPWAADLAQNAVQIVDVASALLLSPITPFVQLTAPGSTPQTSGDNFHHITYQIVVAAIGTNVIVQGEGSHDGTSWFPLAPKDNTVAGVTYSGAQATITANGTYALLFENTKAKYTRFTWVSESAGAPTLDIVEMKGN